MKCCLELSWVRAFDSIGSILREGLRGLHGAAKIGLESNSAMGAQCGALYGFKTAPGAVRVPVRVLVCVCDSTRLSMCISNAI